jgi:hypothetical protein
LIETGGGERVSAEEGRFHFSTKLPAMHSVADQLLLLARRSFWDDLLL